jgi:hypothetical protein
VPHDSLNPVATSVPGIFVAGAAGPKDLDDTMTPSAWPAPPPSKPQPSSENSPLHNQLIEITIC